MKKDITEIQQLIKDWKLKTFYMSFTQLSLSEIAMTELNSFITLYPEPHHKMIALVNNIVYGNLVYNHIIEELLKMGKLIHKASRISDFRNYLPEEHHNSELILLDNIEFTLMTAHEKNELVSLVESLLDNKKLIFLNVADPDLNHAPQSLIHQFEVGVIIGL